MDHFFQIEENPISMVLLGGENSLCLRGWNLLTSSAATLRRLPFWSIPLYQTHLHRKKPSWHRPCWMMDSSRPLLILELCCFCTGLSRAEEGEKSSDVGGGSIFRAIARPLQSSTGPLDTAACTHKHKHKSRWRSSVVADHVLWFSIYTSFYFSLTWNNRFNIIVITRSTLKKLIQHL